MNSPESLPMVVVSYRPKNVIIQLEREREALAVLDSMKRFRSYLYGRKFYVITDHHSLRWLMNIKELTGRLARWSLEFSSTILKCTSFWSI